MGQCGWQNANCEYVAHCELLMLLLTHYFITYASTIYLCEDVLLSVHVTTHTQTYKMR